MKYVDLLEIQVKDNTSAMVVYLYNYLQKLGDVDIDEAGNLWFQRGISVYFPLIVSHMDTVQDVNFAKVFKEKKGEIYGELFGKRCGIGADDKNGIYVAIQLIERTDIPLKCLFTFGEETGAHGAYEAPSYMFNDVAYMLQFDRKGKGDIINYGSENFLADVEKIGAKYGYEEEIGIFTDVTVLSQEHSISAVNLSCGYYYAHTNNEYTNLAELDNAVNFGIDLITNLAQVYPYEKVDYKDNYKFYNYSDSHEIYGECEYCGNKRWLGYDFYYGDYICDDCMNELNQIRDEKENNDDFSDFADNNICKSKQYRSNDYFATF